MALPVLLSHFQVCSRNAPPSAAPQSREHPVLELSFEYLMRKGELRWITLLSDQVRRSNRPSRSSTSAGRETFPLLV